jgi:hypothetical protein
MMSSLAKGARPAEARPSPLAEAVRSWDRFWFAPVDPAPACFIRLLAGALAFYVCFCYSWGLFSYVGPHGWVDTKANDFLFNDIDFYSPAFEWAAPSAFVYKGQSYWSIFFHVQSPGWIVAIHVFFMAASLLYAAGLWCAYTGPLCWLGAMSYAHRAWATVFGLDTMLLILLGYLLIAPTGAVFSMDRWLAVRRARRLGLPDPAVEPSARANFAIRLIQLHFCVIYFASGTSKLLGSMWWNGTAMNQVLLNPMFTPLDSPVFYNTLKFIAGSRWVWELFATAGTLFTLALEISFVFLIWDRRWRWLLMLGSILLHMGIGLLMGLTTFSIVMLVMLVSFMSPQSVRLIAGEYASFASGLFKKRAEGRGGEARELVMSR